MAEIDYRDIPAPGMGVGAGMMRAMRRADPEPARHHPPVQSPPQSPPPRSALLRVVETDGEALRATPQDGPRGLFRSARAAMPPLMPLASERPQRSSAPSYADADSGSAEATAPRPRGERAQRLVNGAGALVSVLLVAGLTWWGYRLAVRDVTGIPVIRALEGPARVAPEDPGGELARHQGLSVNDVTADGTAAPAPDRLMLAPKAEGLADGDVAMAALAEDAGAAGAALSIAPAENPVEPLTGEPLGPDGVISDPALADSAVTATDAPPAGVPEPRPIPRPGTRIATAVPAVSSAEDADIVAALAAAEASITPQAIEEIDPATLLPGTRLVQIDTYDSADSARAGWDAIADAFPDVMTGKRRVIEPAGSDGTAFFRLRAEGFDDVEDARRFCSVLVARVPTCVPALVK